jgi:hypothetical protein
MLALLSRETSAKPEQNSEMQRILKVLTSKTP